MSGSASECEFSCGFVRVMITPNFNIPAISLIEDRFGPFIAGKPLLVPLWFALYLKKCKKCEINVPHWLTVEAIENAIKDEEQSTVTHIQKHK